MSYLCVIRASAMQLKGKLAVITGAGSGIGRQLAVEAARRGLTVALIGRRADALHGTLEMMGHQRNHVALPGDITDPEIRIALKNYIAHWWGRLDVLVNNAGVLAVGPLASTSDAELERLMKTNVIAPAALIRELLPLLHRGAPSRVVNIGSMFGDIAYPLFGAYSASKFGLRGLSIALRREFKEFGVGITYAAPRATKTDAFSNFARLIDPLRMRVDDPAKVARDIWAAVARDADSVYAKGPERLFVLVQRLFPQLVDRSLEAQMADTRVRAFLMSQNGSPTTLEVGLRSSGST
ncbi:SDR family NAD(P)-dependent oxidoreductase [Hyphomicrobium sp. DY-1]|uniref:SDR family NAD(P)-dependent oxidoreductase n=1 Tax=Hyphomicrobium sp. DY-1 TaxID=3075650 RepID=UPI0039C081F4